MEIISALVDFNLCFGGEDVVVDPVTEKFETEAEQMQSTIGSGSSFSVYLTADKRKRDYDSSSDDDLDISEDDEDDDEKEENNGKAKRLMTEEEKLASHQQWYESQIEDNKLNLLKEMREKENKLMMAKWAEERKEFCMTSCSVDRLKEELALLQIMYEQFII